MQHYAPPINRLVNALNRLPGIGPKTAQRLAFHLLNTAPTEALELAEAILEAREKIKFCSVCGNLTDQDPCAYCRDETRDKSLICVVEQPRDLLAIEKTREFKGKYHVLNGVISPMDGVGPDDLNIKTLLNRLKQDRIAEVILATNPTVEGEATAMYLARLIEPLGIKTTRIAHGLPVGGILEYVDELTLAKALEGRHQLF